MCILANPCGAIGVVVWDYQTAFLWVQIGQQSAVEMSSPWRGQSAPRNRASQLQFPQISSGRSSLVLHLLLAAGFGSFKANNLTQLKTKLFNLDLPQLDFFFLIYFFKCKIEIKNYISCYARVTSTRAENFHPVLEPNWEQVLHTAFTYKKQTNFPPSYQEALMKNTFMNKNRLLTSSKNPSVKRVH